MVGYMFQNKHLYIDHSGFIFYFVSFLVGVDIYLFCDVSLGLTMASFSSCKSCYKNVSVLMQ